MTEKPGIKYYDHKQLELHPANMRSVEDDGHLPELAQSILEQGIIQPLVGVPENGRIRVVVGNRRLRAARLLGEKAPLLPVVVREDLGEREQLEMMAVENLQRVDVDPISEGKHYRRLIDAHGVSRNEIARRTGKSLAHVENRLKLLRLAPPVQRLIASGQLPIGAGAHLLTIQDQKLQCDVALRLADAGILSLSKIGKVAERVKVSYEESVRRVAPRKNAGQGMERLAQAMKGSRAIKAEDLACLSESEVSWAELNRVLQATCAACQVGQIGTPLKWGDLLKATERTCEECGLDYLADACEQCPLVEALALLRELLEAKHD